MNNKQQLQFIHKCAVLLESGISLSESIELILEIEKKGKNAIIIKKIYAEVIKGISLSKSITYADPKFNVSLLTMIEFGETSGILAATLRQALLSSEKSGVIKNKIVSALVYPFFIVMATTAMTLFLVVYIFPKILPLFSSLNITLPLLTRIVQEVYRLIISYGLWSILVTIGIFCTVMYLYKKYPKKRFLLQLLFLNIPICRVYIKKYFICNYIRLMSTLLECGLPLHTSLSQISKSSRMLPYSLAIEKCAVGVERGTTLSSLFKNEATLFPNIVSSMTQIGERTGSLALMLKHISEIYEEELDLFIKRFTTLIEPVLMIVMGIIVGSVALSIILPIYEITNHLQH